MERDLPRTHRVPVGFTMQALLEPSLTCAPGGWMRRAGSPGSHRALSSLLSPSAAAPAPPRPARPPAQNRKGKEVISTVSGSPEKLPSSEGAGGIPGAGDKSKPGESGRPAAPGPAAFCVCHFPDSAEHVSCGCHAAGRRGAVGSSRPGPGWQGGGLGVGGAPATTSLPVPVPPLPRWPLPVPTDLRPGTLLMKSCS